MENKLRAGIIGATGMVGQRFITLLAEHPMFEISVLAASSRSAGKPYEEAVSGKWKMNAEIPEKVKNMKVYDASDVQTVSSLCDFTFCAVDMKKDEIRALEEAYAKAETLVVSNNSAHRGNPCNIKPVISFPQCFQTPYDNKQNYAKLSYNIYYIYDTLCLKIEFN